MSQLAITSSEGPDTSGCPSYSFNVQSLKSPVFQIVLADGDWATYYIHKEILASLSLELKNHVENEMCEGIQGSMVLREVDEETMQRIFEWAYLRSYTINRSDDANTIMAHMKVYVFADRFNIKPLQDACLSKLENLKVTLEEQSRRMLPSMRDLTPVIEAMSYAVQNLPSLKDKAVDFLLQYVSENMADLSDFTLLQEVFQMFPEVETALMQVSSSTDEPTWKTKILQHWGSHEAVYRFLKQCHGCERTLLIMRMESRGDRMTIQADHDGWFGNYPELNCEQDTKFWLSCRTCRDELLDQYREIYREMCEDDYSPPFHGSPDVDDSPPFYDSPVVDDSPPFYGSPDVDDSPPFYGSPVVDDSPPVSDSPIVDDSPYDDDVYIGTDSVDYEAFAGEDDDDIDVDDDANKVCVSNTHYNGVSWGRSNRIQDEDAVSRADSDDIFPREEISEENYQRSFIDRDDREDVYDYDDDLDFDVNENIEDGYDPDCYDGDLGELYD